MSNTKGKRNPDRVAVCIHPELALHHVYIVGYRCLRRTRASAVWNGQWVPFGAALRFSAHAVTAACVALRGDRVCRVRTLRSGPALWSQRPCRGVNAWHRASSGGNVQGGRDRCVRPALALRTLVALQQARTRSLFHPTGRWRPPRLLAIRGSHCRSEEVRCRTYCRDMGNPRLVGWDSYYNPTLCA